MAASAVRRLALVGLLVVTGACGSASTNLVGPTATKCQISVTDFTKTFSATGGTGTVSIDAARECGWTASSPSWVTFSDAQGQGPARLDFTVLPNQVARSRTGNIDINGQVLGIVQEAADCGYSLDGTGRDVPAAGASGNVGVSALDGCSWRATSSAVWLSVTAGAEGSGAGSVRYAVDRNAGPARTARLDIAGRTYTVNQAAAEVAPAPPPEPAPPPAPAPPPTPACQYAVSPTALEFAAGGGQAQLAITTANSCTWQAASQAAWVSVAPISGNGSATVGVEASANAGGQRSTTLMVAGRTITVTQDAFTPTEVRLSGRVRQLSGDCPDVTFSVDGTQVVTTRSTVYSNQPCGELKNGKEVEVRGLLQADGTVVATLVSLRE